MKAITVFALLCMAAPREAYAVSWGSDLASALRESQASQKPVMVDFYIDGCGWCDKLDDETFADSSVNKLAAKFICVKIDGRRRQDLAAKYNVRGYPTVIFLGPDGRALEQGVHYLPPADFAKFMNDVLRKAGGSAKKEKAVAGPAKTAKPMPPKTPEDKPSTTAKDVMEKAADKIETMLNGGFELSGIIYDAKGPEAIVNNTLVKVGDVIGGAKVAAIEETRVKLTLDEREIVLRLQR